MLVRSTLEGWAGDLGGASQGDLGGAVEGDLGCAGQGDLGGVAKGRISVLQVIQDFPSMSFLRNQ